MSSLQQWYLNLQNRTIIIERGQKAYMRTQWSPNKWHKELPAPPEITLGVVTHCSNDPYYEGKIKILRLCLDSMLKGVAGLNYELIIWDNGSVESWHKKLAKYNPTVFVKSPNIGVGNAQIGIASIARGKILCITDDDVLFHPMWFDKQVKILQTFPNVGAVSGSPQRTAFRIAVFSNLEWGKKNNALKIYRGISDEWERDFCISITKHPEANAKDTATEPDYLLTYSGVKAWAHGNHMQFLGYTDIIREHIKARKSGVYFDVGHNFNISIDQAGLLNLTTFDRTAVHIGNVIDQSIKKIMKEWHVSISSNP